MCKENWNELKFNYKKLLIMTRELDTMYIIMGNDDARVDKCHYPHQLNQEYYKTILKTKGERIINAPIHMRELQTKGDASCMLHEY
jgi:hypothetical protein